MRPALPPHILLAASLLLLLSASASRAQSPILVDHPAEQRLGRYTTQGTEPPAEASEPLQVVAYISFPRETVRTISDAVHHTLMRTGYALVAPSSLAPEASRFLTLPLPESQRELGPYRVQAILDVLLGKTWQWHCDPVQRRLWFTVAPRYASLLQPTAQAPTHVVPVASATAATPADDAHTPATVTPVRPPALVVPANY